MNSNYRLPLLFAAAVSLYSQSAVLTPSADEPGSFQIDMPAEPKWQAFVNGKSVARMTLEAPGAVACRFEFDYLALGPGEELFLYSSGGAIHGPYVEHGPIHFPNFESKLLPGERFTVEVIGSPSADWPFRTRNLSCREDVAGLEFKQRYTPGRGPGPGLSRTGTFNGAIVPYREFSGRAVFEGDILLNPQSTAKSGGERDSLGIIGTSRYWPGGRVPYEPPSIGFTTDEEDRINAAIAYWNGLFPGIFVQRTNEPDYVIFDWAPDVCQSHVGRAGGLQRILLDSGCGKQAIRHELGHAIGLIHEQSRQDRDSFVKVNYENIKDGYSDNFDIVSAAYGAQVGPYDYYSLMHYSSYAFNNGGGKTIVPLQPLANGYVLGTTLTASAGDIAGVQRLLCLSALKVTSTMSIPNDVDGLVLSIPVGLPNYCSWTATEGASWITLVKSSGIGGQAVTFKATPNAALYTRTANIYVNGQPVKISQAGGAI